MCVDIQVISRTGTADFWFDESSEYVSYNPRTKIRSVGAGCIATGQTTGASMGTSSIENWPTNAVSLTFQGSRLPANALAATILGGNNTSLGATPLPLELPTSAAGNSGSCFLFNDILLAIPAITDMNGSMSLTLGMIVHAGFNGLNLYCQIASPDAQANNFGIVTTNGGQFHLIAPFTSTVGTVEVEGNTGPTGTVRKTRGLIIELR